jgi:hypothetical protein
MVMGCISGRSLNWKELFGAGKRRDMDAVLGDVTVYGCRLGGHDSLVS